MTMKYTKTHEWVKLEGETATVGITSKAAKELGDIVYVELPPKGRIVEAGEEGVVLESTKAAVDLYFPLSGEIIEPNLSLKENPEKINKKSESEGWLYKIKITNKKEIENLLSESDYQKNLL